VYIALCEIGAEYFSNLYDLDGSDIKLKTYRGVYKWLGYE